MKPFLKVFAIVLTIAYPFIIYFGLLHFQASSLIPLLLLLLGLRWFGSQKNSERYLVMAIAIILAMISLALGSQLGLKFYPVLVNFGFLVLFAGSLLFPPSIVERMVRIRDPDLSPRAIIYIRKVTWLWSVFFVINGSIATVTALWASNEVWTLYNGFIAYLLIGLLAGGEWLVRQRVMRDQQN